MSTPLEQPGVGQVGVLDGHNDLPWAMRELCDYDLDQVDLLGSVPQLQTDLPRLRSGGVAAQFWSVFVPSDLDGGAALTATLEQVDFVHRLAARYPGDLALAGTADEVEQVMAGGRIACLMGMEGGHCINESLGALRMMHTLGVRYMTLTHNDNVPWADSATDEPVLGGLSDFGEDVVREMNRIGMLVDLSHVSADVMRHALKVAETPVIFSHSSARSLCDVARNVPDDVLTTMAANDGVCMVAFVPQFVSPAFARWTDRVRELVLARGLNVRSHCVMQAAMDEVRVVDPPPAATLDDVVAHVEHVREVAGLDHVGIGGDYDGSVFMPTGMEDVSSYPRLFDALHARGWSAAELDALGHGNVLRVLRAAEDVATP